MLFFNLLPSQNIYLNFTKARAAAAAYDDLKSRLQQDILNDIRISVSCNARQAEADIEKAVMKMINAAFDK